MGSLLTEVTGVREWVFVPNSPPPHSHIPISSRSRYRDVHFHSISRPIAESGSHSLPWRFPCRSICNSSGIIPTIRDIQGHSPNASLFKCDFLYHSAVLVHQRCRLGKHFADYCHQRSCNLLTPRGFSLSSSVARYLCNGLNFCMPSIKHDPFLSRSLTAD